MFITIAEIRRRRHLRKALNHNLNERQVPTPDGQMIELLQTTF